MFKITERITFTKIVAIVLMFLMGLVVVLSLADLSYIVFKDILKPPVLLITFDEVDQILSAALWVLIAMELLHSIRIYLEKDTGYTHHVETVVVVSIIAVARKVIVLNLHDYDGVVILGLAAIIFALCGGYLMLRWSHRYNNDKPI